MEQGFCIHECLSQPLNNSDPNNSDPSEVGNHRRPYRSIHPPLTHGLLRCCGDGVNGVKRASPCVTKLMKYNPDGFRSRKVER